MKINELLEEENLVIKILIYARITINQPDLQQSERVLYN